MLSTVKEKEFYCLHYWLVGDEQGQTNNGHIKVPRTEKMLHGN